MTRIQPEVPTHLNVEDKVLFGLTVRQFLFLLVGSSASYAAWEQARSVGEAVRMVLVVACIATTVAFAFIRPAGRALEEWLVVALIFVASPSGAVWQPREPQPSDWRLASGTWQELAPSLTWAEDSGP
jgi:hypothetical protein